jgi:2,3-dihydroxybenzoate-AMP ligase
MQDRGVARYKWPERIEELDALPLTPIGKVAKKELRERLAASASTPGTTEA